MIKHSSARSHFVGSSCWQWVLIKMSELMVQNTHRQNKSNMFTKNWHVPDKVEGVVKWGTCWHSGSRRVARHHMTPQTCRHWDMNLSSWLVATWGKNVWILFVKQQQLLWWKSEMLFHSLEQGLTKSDIVPRPLPSRINWRQLCLTSIWGINILYYSSHNAFVNIKRKYKITILSVS